MIMSGMNRKNDMEDIGKDGKRKVMKWNRELEMVELIIDGFEDGKFNCCYFSLLSWNIKK